MHSTPVVLRPMLLPDSCSLGAMQMHIMQTVAIGSNVVLLMQAGPLLLHSGSKDLLPSGARSPMRLGMPSPRRSGMQGVLLANALAVVWQAIHTKRTTSLCVITCPMLRPMPVSLLPRPTQISTSRLRSKREHLERTSRERTSFLLQHTACAQC